jgi:lipoprotein-anchoring transpeptidase ErfK/SrfK
MFGKAFLRRIGLRTPHFSLFTLIICLFTTPTVSAQSLRSTHPGEEVGSLTIANGPTNLQQGHTGEVTTETVLGLRPPLPFKEPQIGPLIKRSFTDDVDQWTTAFIPQRTGLDHLTAVDFPDEEKWIRVDLSEQTVVAYENDKPVRAFIISSGLPGTPTVTGEFRIRTKVKEQTMSGGVGRNYYNLPGVKWVQYFYSDYGFHGTYWHNDFGRPKSHGCINMTNADAKWLFDWAGPVWDNQTIWFKSTEDNPGTLVVITE